MSLFILFCPNQEYCALHDEAFSAIAQTTAFRVSQERYEDGSHSGWYRITLGNASLSSEVFHDIALQCEARPDVFGAVMITTAQGDLYPPTQPKEHYGLGARSSAPPAKPPKP